MFEYFSYIVGLGCRLYSVFNLFDLYVVRFKLFKFFTDSLGVVFGYF